MIEATVAARAASPDEQHLCEALRAGDENAFAALVQNYQPSLVRVARSLVHDRAVAEEVVQDTWLGVIRGLDRFEGRSSLKTWIFRILVNTARTRAERERRTTPFSALVGAEEEQDGPTVAPERFLDAEHPRWPGHWASPPSSWSGIPERRLLSKETSGRIAEAINGLPSAQRQVITLRDVEGWRADEVCRLLGLTEVNQRVLLHRARARVRQALEDYLN